MVDNNTIVQSHSLVKTLTEPSPVLFKEAVRSKRNDLDGRDYSTLDVS